MSLLRGSYNDIYQKCVERFPGREEQIDIFLRLFRNPTDPLPPLFVFGPSGTGKTSVLRHLMTVLNARYAMVNCLECNNQRLIYHCILTQIQSQRSHSCGDFSRFLEVLRAELKCPSTDERTFLIFDNVQRLRREFNLIFTAFLRLDQLITLNVCTIFISNVAYAELRNETGGREPLSIYFPAYSDKTIITKIICLDEPPPIAHNESGSFISDEVPHKTLFQEFVALVVEVFLPASSSINELRHLASRLYPKYVYPLLSGQVSLNEKTKLYTFIKPYLQQVLQSISLREVSFSDVINVSHNVEALNSSLTATVQSAKQMSSYFLSALPRCAKFLLIAAYLASNNPSTYDERLFGKSYKQTTRRKPKKSSKNSDAQQTDGPKAFSLDRLLHIYSCISQNDDTFDDKQTTEYVESLYSQPYCSHFYHQYYDDLSNS
jgi:origin recognition complex subunit 5